MEWHDYCSNLQMKPRIGKAGRLGGADKQQARGGAAVPARGRDTSELCQGPPLPSLWPPPGTQAGVGVSAGLAMGPTQAQGLATHSRLLHESHNRRGHMV